jgi:hypothetical protein
MRTQISEFARNLFEQDNEFLAAMQKKGWSKASSDLLKLKSGPTYELLRTAFKVISQDAMNSLMYTSPVDGPRIAQCQAYAGFLETLDYILSQSSDREFMEECVEVATERAESEARAESHKSNEYTNFE